MATSANAQYKKSQQAARKSKRRITVLHTSCAIDDITGFKTAIDGTFRRRHEYQPRTTKAGIKQEKQKSHKRGHYWIKRTLNYYPLAWR